MKKTSLSLLLSTLLAGSAFGQCFAVTTLTTAGNGQNGTMFNIVNTSNGGIVIGSFDQCYFTAGTSNMSIYTKTGTWSGFETNPAAWTLVGTAPGVAHGIAPVLDPLPIPVNVTIGPGATQAFYITGDTGTTVAYTTGVNQLGTVIGSDTNLQVTAGIGVAYSFGANFGLPTAGRLWNGRVNYCPVGAGTVLATATTTGEGCIRKFASFYELFSPGTFDLSNTTLTWLNTSTGYTILNGIPGVILPPTPAAQIVAAGVLDGEQLFTLSAPMPIPGGSTSALNVCTKGYIATAAGNGINFSLTPSVFLSFPQTTWACWHDFDQSAAGSGDITFEEIGGIAYVTVNAVYTWTTTAPNTLQWQFNLATGNVTLVFGAYAGTAYSTLVGYSPGGPNLDPGNTDISAVLGSGVIVLASPEVPPLALAATSRPITNTNWNLTTSEIPATGVFGLDIFGVADPAIPDLSFLGMPTCQLRASLDVIAGPWFVTGPTHNYSFFIPNSPAILNLHLYTQSAVFQVPPVNSFGAITSNGIDGKVGDY